jgi:hypothetical protein
MAPGQVQDAKARFTESVNTALKRDPRSQPGVPVPIQDWGAWSKGRLPSLRTSLSAAVPCFEDSLPARGVFGRRPPVEFKCAAVCPTPVSLPGSASLNRVVASLYSDQEESVCFSDGSALGAGVSAQGAGWAR